MHVVLSFGSIAVMALSESTRLYFNYSGGVGLLVYGGVLVFGVLAMPRGLVGLWERRTKRASKKASLAAGAKSLHELTDQPYGDRNGAITDPLGNIWYIATHVKDVQP